MPFLSLGKGSSTNGITNLHIAAVTQNDTEGFKGDKPVRFEGVANISATFDSNEATFEADNKTYESETQVTGATLTVDVAGSTPEFDEYVLGYSRQNAALIAKGTSGNPVMVKYEVTKSDGSSVFVQAGVAKFAPAPVGGQTKGSSLQNTSFTAKIAAPSNNSLGDVGWSQISTTDPKVKALGLSVEELRERIFGQFYWDGTDGASGGSGSGTGTGSGTGSGSAYTGLTVTPAPSASIKYGDYEESVVEVFADRPTGGAVKVTGAEIETTSTNPDIVRFDTSNMKFKITGMGTATVTLKAYGVSKSYTITVS